MTPIGFLLALYMLELGMFPIPFSVGLLQCIPILTVPVSLPNATITSHRNSNDCDVILVVAFRIHILFKSRCNFDW